MTIREHHTDKASTLKETSPLRTQNPADTPSSGITATLLRTNGLRELLSLLTSHYIITLFGKMLSPNERLGYRKLFSI